MFILCRELITPWPLFIIIAIIFFFAAQCSEQCSLYYCPCIFFFPYKAERNTARRASYISYLCDLVSACVYVTVTCTVISTRQAALLVQPVRSDSIQSLSLCVVLCWNELSPLQVQATTVSRQVQVPSPVTVNSCILAPGFHFTMMHLLSWKIKHWVQIICLFYFPISLWTFIAMVTIMNMYCSYSNRVFIHSSFLTASTILLIITMATRGLCAGDINTIDWRCLTKLLFLTTHITSSWQKNNFATTTILASERDPAKRNKKKKTWSMLI